MINLKFLLFTFIIITIVFSIKNKNKMFCKMKNGDDSNAIPSGCIDLYQDCNFLGQKLRLCSDVPNLVPFGFNDMASSIKLGKDTKATLYEHVNYLGRTANFDKDIACFPMYQESVDIAVFNDLA